VFCLPLRERPHGTRVPSIPLLSLQEAVHERSGGLLNRTQYPSDVIALAVLWCCGAYATNLACVI
jgi:hypothetical protein